MACPGKRSLVRFLCHWLHGGRAFPGDIVCLGGDGQDELATLASLVLSLLLVFFPPPRGRGLHTLLAVRIRDRQGLHEPSAFLRSHPRVEGQVFFCGAR